jgi:hypothetical protein
VSVRTNLDHLDKALYLLGEDGASYIMPSPIWPDQTLRIIASWGEGWDHVSVSLENRCPVWQEMCYVKDLFWRPEECVMQLHPPKADWVNYHEHCLHLWRPQGKEIPQPPLSLIGPKGITRKEAHGRAAEARAAGPEGAGTAGG